jgi:hypothetical protein
MEAGADPNGDSCEAWEGAAGDVAAGIADHEDR